MSDISGSDGGGAGVAAHLDVAGAHGSADWAASGPAPAEDCSVLSVLGCLSPPACPDAQSFLLQLAHVWRDFMAKAHLLGATSCTPSVCPAACVGTAFWHAFSEVNVLLARHFSTLPTSRLRGYHSFTRAARSQLWARFAVSQGAQMGEEPTFCAAGGRPHVVITRFMLEHILVAYSTASVVVYTIEVPDWLRGWCARWGQPAAAPLRVVALFAFEEDGSRSPRALYIPVVAE